MDVYQLSTLLHAIVGKPLIHVVHVGDDNTVIERSYS